MHKKQTLLTASILLISILACATPPAATVSAPSPTVDAGQLATMVANTVSTALAQTEQAGPTYTPTPEPTPTLEAGATGSLLEIQQDSSTLFTDQRAGYEAAIPFGWLAVRVNGPEYLESFSLAETADEHIQDSLLAVQDADPLRFRLFVYDVREAHVKNEFVSNMNFIWDESGSISFATDEDLKANAARSVEALPGLEILSTKISATANSLPYGLIESKYTGKNPAGEDLVVFQNQALFNAGTGAMVITVSTVEELKDMVFAEFNSMLESIKLTAK